MWCISHRLNLAVRDVWKPKDLDDEYPVYNSFPKDLSEARGVVVALMDKVKGVVSAARVVTAKLIHALTALYDLSEVDPDSQSSSHFLAVYNATRWNSEFTMLSKVLELRSSLEIIGMSRFG